MGGVVNVQNCSFYNFQQVVNHTYHLFSGNDFRITKLESFLKKLEKQHFS